MKTPIYLPLEKVSPSCIALWGEYHLSDGSINPNYRTIVQTPLGYNIFELYYSGRLTFKLVSKIKNKEHFQNTMLKSFDHETQFSNFGLTTVHGLLANTASSIVYHDDGILKFVYETSTGNLYKPNLA